MANTNVARNGQFVWYEHLTKDANAAIAFYTDVVGWKTEPFGSGSGYTMWVGDDGPLGGVTAIPPADAKTTPPGWWGNVQVASVDATVALAKKLGGKVLKQPSNIPTVGRFALIEDPQGVRIALFRPNALMPSADASKPGAFCWSELLTSNSAAAFQFYAEIFGWKIVEERDMGPMGVYRTFGLDSDLAIGGMMTTREGGPPSMWLYYTESQDLDAAIARATKAGATVMNGPMPVPGGARIVHMMDPQGVPFAMHEAVKA